MAKKRYKQKYCLNCRHTFANETIHNNSIVEDSNLEYSNEQQPNFCPKCGQENTQRRQTFKTLILDFLGDYFTFDSRLFKSIAKLLFAPGELTKSFNNGQRVQYIPPLRMFLFTGVVFFSLLTWHMNQQGMTDDLTLDLDNGTKILIKDLSENKLKSAYEKDIRDGLKEYADTSKPAVKDSILQNMDTLVALYWDSLKNGTMNIRFWGNDTLVVKPIAFIEMTKTKSPDEIVKELKVEGYWKQTLVKQVAKSFKESKNLVTYFLGRLSLMVLLMIPVIAFILKILYVRHQSFYYLDHFVFVLHIHSFLYVLFTIPLLVLFAFLDFSKMLIPIFVIWSIVYLFFSLKKVYQQKTGKTLVKQMLLTFAYYICIVIFLLMTVLISFWLF